MPSLLAAESSNGNFVDVHVELWHWAVLLAIILVLLLVDLLVVHKEAHEVHTKEAAIESAVWISCGVAFSLVIWWWFGGAATGEYMSGYLIEKSLSIDNVFVWALIMGYFRVPQKYQHRVLFWGIFGALILRAIFIFLGVAVIERFDWVLYLFGAFLLYTAGKLIFSDDDHVDPGESKFLKLVNRFVHTTPELPLSDAERAEMQARPTGLKATLAEIALAIKEMPPTMRQLWWMKLFQWYGMLCYWVYIVPALARTMFGTSDAASTGFRDAGLLNGQIGGFYNLVAFVGAFAMVPFTRRLGAKAVHAVCLTLAGIGMWCIPAIQDKALLFIPMIGVGLAWASIMGNPYVLLAGSIPPERAGVYMGIFNMFIVIPMIIQMLTLPLFYNSLLGGHPENVIRLAGLLLLAAAVAVCFVKPAPAAARPPST